MAALGTVSLHLALTPSGKSDSRYEDGDDGSAAIPLTWATVPSFSGKLEGTPFSVDVRAGYLDEPGSPDATITVEGSLPSGWTLDGDDLEYSGTGTGLATIRLKAERSGFEAFSNFFIVEAIAVAASDTTAPTIPTGLTATPGSGSVTLEWDASSDPHDGTEPGSGVDEYDVLLGAATVHTLAGSAGLSRELIETIIGGNDGTPDSTQDGADWSLSFGGSGIDGTSDQVLTRSVVVAGDAFAVVKIVSVTTAASFAKLGIMARESTAAGAKYVSIHFQSNGRIKLRARTAADVASVDQVNQPFAAPAWFKLERAGDAWTASYSTDGGTWTVLGSVTLSMSADVEWGLFLTSNSAGVNATCEFEQWNLNNVARLSYQHTTAVGGSYTIKARDVEGNLSAASTASTAAPVASATPKKWHPGNYMWSQPPQTPANGSTTPNYGQISGLSNFKGALMAFSWGLLEPTKDNYDFSRITSRRNSLAASGKRMGIWFLDRSSTGSGPATSFDSNWLPNYIDSAEYDGGWSGYNFGIQGKYWVSAVMDREIALLQAMAEEFDDDSMVELLIINLESAKSGIVASDYTTAAAVAQMMRLMDAASAAWPKTNVFVSLNFIGSLSGSELVQLTQHAQAKKIGIFGPDHISPGTVEYDVFTGDIGGVDYRGVLPRGLRYGDVTVGGIQCANAAIADQDLADLAITHEFYRHVLNGTSCQNWSTGIVPSVNANPNNYVSAKPSAYDAIDTG